jgi:hypothetical protein
MASKVLLPGHQARNIVAKFRMMKSTAHPTTAQICKCMFDEFARGDETKHMENPCIVRTVDFPCKDRTRVHIDVFSIMYRGERMYARVVHTSENPAAYATNEDAERAFMHHMPNVLHDNIEDADQAGRAMFAHLNPSCIVVDDEIRVVQCSA